MDVSWTTVISSIVLSFFTAILGGGGLVWLCREWISVRLNKAIQHEYDKKFLDYQEKLHHEYELKLEFEKAYFHKIMDEHQTRFKYWHEEKANAIKILFCSLTELNRALNECVYVILNMKAKETDKETVRKSISLDFPSLYEKCSNDWHNLKIYLDENDDLVISNFMNECSNFVKCHTDFINSGDFDSYVLQINIILKNLNELLKKLQNSFHDALCVAITEIPPQIENTISKT